MKVTKLIREYVEEQVAAAYNSKENPYAAQAAMDKQMLEAFTQELHDQQKEAIEKFIAEHEIFEDGWRGNRQITTASTNVPSFTWYVTQAMIDEKKWKDENSRQKRDKIREILLALELGANRKELEEMIAKLLEGV